MHSRHAGVCKCMRHPLQGFIYGKPIGAEVVGGVPMSPWGGPAPPPPHRCHKSEPPPSTFPRSSSAVHWEVQRNGLPSLGKKKFQKCIHWAFLDLFSKRNQGFFSSLGPEPALYLPRTKTKQYPAPVAVDPPHQSFCYIRPICS